MDKSLKTINGFDILEWVFAALLMLQCNSVYQRMTNINLHIEEFIVIVSMVMLIARYGKRLCIEKSVGQIILFLVAAGVLIFICNFSSNHKDELVMHFFLFFPCVILYLSQSNNLFEIYRKFSHVVLVISLASTLIWFMAEVLNILNTNTSVTISWGGIRQFKGYFGLFYESQIDNTFGIGGYRNTGIFCEAPMHSLVLSLALAYEVFISKERSKKRIMLFSVCILTTVATTGILFLLLCFALMFWNKIMTQKKAVRVLYIIVMIVLIPLLYIFIDSIFEAKSVTSSYSKRMIDYVAGIRAFIDNPIIGVGYGNISRLAAYKYDLYLAHGLDPTNIGFSNSLMAIIGQGGIVLSTIFYLPIIKILLGRYDSNKKHWCISLMFLITTTIFNTRFIMIFFLVMIYAYICNKKKSFQTTTE